MRDINITYTYVIQREADLSYLDTEGERPIWRPNIMLASEYPTLIAARWGARNAGFHSGGVILRVPDKKHKKSKVTTFRM